MWSYLRDLRELSTGVRRFIFSEVLLGIGIGLFNLVLNLHLLEMKLDEEQIGQLGSFGTIVMGLISIPTGLMANRFGRKRILVTGLTLMGCGYSLFGFVENLLGFYFAQLIFSIGITMLITSEIQLLYHYCHSKKEETQAFSLLFAVFTLFTGVGTIIGGYLPNWLGGMNTSYQSSLLVGAGCLFLVSLIRGLFLPKERTEVTNYEKRESSSQSPWRLPNRSILIFSFFTFMSGFSFAFIVPFQNVILKFRYDLSDEWVSILLTMNGFFLFIGSFLMPYLLERLGIRKTYFTVYAVNTILAFFLFLAIPLPLFAVLFLVRGGSFTLLNNLIDSQGMSAIPDEDRNLFAGLRSVTRSIGSSISTYMTGVILAQKNYYLPFLFTAGALLAGYLYYRILVQPILLERLGERNADKE